MEDKSNDISRQKELWQERLQRKQMVKGYPKYGGMANPGACQAHNKAAGRKGGIRRQGSKRG